MPDDLQHSIAVTCRNVQRKFSCVTPPRTLVVVDGGAIVRHRFAARRDRWQVTDRVGDADRSRQTQIHRFHHAMSIAEADRRRITNVRRGREYNSATSFSADKDESLSLLRNTKVSGVQNSPITVVAQAVKTVQHGVKGGAALMRRQTDDVLQHEYPRTKPVHEPRILLKKAVAFVFFLRRPERSDGGKTLARRPANDDVDVTAFDLQARDDIADAYGTHITSDADGVRMVLPKRLHGSGVSVDAENRLETLAPCVLKSLRERTCAAEQVNNLGGRRHVAPPAPGVASASARTARSRSSARTAAPPAMTAALAHRSKARSTSATERPPSAAAAA